jgi:DNA-binding Lrp family transcriptional regulator
MEGWWDELDTEILDVLKTAGPTDPENIARVLGMSTGAVCSCLALLAAEGRVCIRSVEATLRPGSVVKAA